MKKNTKVTRASTTQGRRQSDAAVPATVLGFAPLRAARVYEQIALQIEHAIFERRLRRGDKLPAERELAVQFSVSRVAVREALRVLQFKGLLDVRKGPNGGYFVRHADSEIVKRDLRTLALLGEFSVAELCEVRMAIEPEVARLAAERATDIDRAALSAVLEKRSELASAAGHPGELDLEFHRLIAVAAKNPVYVLLLHSLMELEADLVVPRFPFALEDHASVADSHSELFDAIMRGDAKAAEAAMRRHVTDLHERRGGAQFSRRSAQP